jgi:GntR family transcriptional regulator
MFRFSGRKEPLYAMIQRDLLAKIERGAWSIGHRLPSEDELQAQYGVSRGTVRKALSELELEGYVSRTSGKGTFVTRVFPRLGKTPGIRGFTQQLSLAGLRTTTKVLSTGIIHASDAKGKRVEEGFGIPGDADVVHIERLREGNGMPFAIQSVYLPPALCPGILEEDLRHLFRLYMEKYNRRIVRADEIIRVSGASMLEAKLLGMDPGAPLMIRDRVSYDQNDEPFEVLHSIDRGDRFEYQYVILSDDTRVPDTS